MCRIILFAATLGIVGGHAPALAAPPLLQTLRQSDSRAELILHSGFGSLQGTLREYDGRLLLDPTDFTKSSVELSTNLSALSLRSSNDIASVGLERLLLALPPIPANFKSTRILSAGPSRYRIDGILAHAGRQRPASVLVKLLESSPNRTTVQVEVSGNVDDKSGVLASLPAIERANLNCRLVFGPVADRGLRRKG